MFERFTDRARKVMALANQEAQRFKQQYIGTEHILLALVREGSGVGANVLRNLEIDFRRVRVEVEKLVKPGPDFVAPSRLPQTPRAKKVIEFAIEEARNLNHNYVGTEHLLLGMLREREGVAAQVLIGLGLILDDVRDEILNLLGSAGADQQTAQGKDAQSGSPRPSASLSIDRQVCMLRRLIEGQIRRMEEEKDRLVCRTDYVAAAEMRERVEMFRFKLAELDGELAAVASKLGDLLEETRR